MKRLVQVLPRNTYVGEKSYLHELALCDLLGQADTLVIETFGYRIGPDARVKLQCFATSVPSGRPSEIGTIVKMTDPATGTPVDLVTVTALRSGPISVPGPFSGRLEIVTTVESVNPTQTPNPEFDLSVQSTVIVQG